MPRYLVGLQRKDFEDDLAVPLCGESLHSLLPSMPMIALLREPRHSLASVG